MQAERAEMETRPQQPCNCCELLQLLLRTFLKTLGRRGSHFYRIHGPSCVEADCVARGSAPECPEGTGHRSRNRGRDDYGPPGARRPRPTATSINIQAGQRHRKREHTQVFSDNFTSRSLTLNSQGSRRCCTVRTHDFRGKGSLAKTGLPHAGN